MLREYLPIVRCVSCSTFLIASLTAAITSILQHVDVIRINCFFFDFNILHLMVARKFYDNGIIWRMTLQKLFFCQFFLILLHILLKLLHLLHHSLHVHSTHHNKSFLSIFFDFNQIFDQNIFRLLNDVIFMLLLSGLTVISAAFLWNPSPIASV